MAPIYIIYKSPSRILFGFELLTTYYLHEAEGSGQAAGSSDPRAPPTSPTAGVSPPADPPTPGVSQKPVAKPASLACYEHKVCYQYFGPVRSLLGSTGEGRWKCRSSLPIDVWRTYVLPRIKSRAGQRSSSGDGSGKRPFAF